MGFTKQDLDRMIRQGLLTDYWCIRPNVPPFRKITEPDFVDLCDKIRELEAVVSEFNETIKQAGFKHRLHLEAWCDDEPWCGDAPPGYADEDDR